MWRACVLAPIEDVTASDQRKKSSENVKTVAINTDLEEFDVRFYVFFFRLLQNQDSITWQWK